MALVVSVAVPVTTLLMLWSNLTKPLWYNEQWRANFVSTSGDWWFRLRSVNAPFSAGWFFLERACTSLFGNTELSIRLPTALFLPLTTILLLLLAERWVPRVAAVAIALVGSLTGALVYYAVQLAEYQIDAAAAIAVILFHEVAWDDRSPGLRTKRLYLAYSGIVVACVFGTPALFVAAPVLILDLVRAWRDRSKLPRALAAVGAGVLILLHLGLFVVRQNALTKNSYWNGWFVPHHGIPGQLRFVWEGLKGFVVGSLTGALRTGLPTFLSSKWSWILEICFVILLGLGVVETARSVRGRTVLAGVGGSLLLTLVASYLRYWPFGFVRTNYYLLPLLILLAGIGGVRNISRLRHLALRTPRHVTRKRVVPLGAAGLALATVALTALVAAATYELSSVRQLRDSAGSVDYGGDARAAVATVRARALPGAAVVVAGYMATAGWEYYQFDYSGRSTRTGPQLPRDRVLLVPYHGMPEITQFVSKLRPSELFLYVPQGSGKSDLDLDLGAIDKAQQCRSAGGQKAFASSGLLVTLICGAQNHREAAIDRPDLRS